MEDQNTRCCSDGVDIKRASLLNGNITSLQTSQWLGWLPYFMVYRFVSAVAIVSWLVWDLFKETSAFSSVLIPHTRGRYEFWFLFAVNWCFLLVAISASLHCCLCTFRVLTRKSKKELHEMKIGFSGAMYWFTYNAASNLILVNLVGYLIRLCECQNECEFLYNTRVICKHALLAAYTLLDIMLVATPFYFLHVIYPVSTLAIYLLTNALLRAYAKLPKTLWSLYPSIPWHDLDLAVLEVIFVLVFVVLTQFFLICLYHGRKALANKITEAQMPALLRPMDDSNYDPFAYSGDTKKVDQRLYYDSTRELYRGSLPQSRP